MNEPRDIKDVGYIQASIVKSPVPIEAGPVNPASVSAPCPLNCTLEPETIGGEYGCIATVPTGGLYALTVM